MLELHDPVVAPVEEQDRQADLAQAAVIELDHGLPAGALDEVAGVPGPRQDHVGARLDEFVVGRLPEDFRARNPEVAWRSMRATRNVIAHEHEQVDYDIIWNAFVGRLPTEAEKLRHLLEGLNA